MLKAHVVLVVGALTAPLAAKVYAAWDYPIEAKFAFYDAGRLVCGSRFNEVDVKRSTDWTQIPSGLSKKEQKRIRSTELYKSLLNETRDEFEKLLDQQQSREQKVIACKAILRIDGYGL